RGTGTALRGRVALDEDSGSRGSSVRLMGFLFAVRGAAPRE
ncbi:MAG: hypothetical protein QOJ68_567, partial [Blastococcus sp.]|nr:hypothetical protein [Blastococcus sp.]